MSDLALPTTGTGAWRRFANGCREALLALAQGLAAAHRYERLARLSDAELKRLGLTRADLGRFALYGKPRPR